MGNKEKKSHETKQGQEPSTSQYHVLVVDDSLVDRKLIERLLKISSYKVTTVESAIRALEFLGLDHNHTSVHGDRHKINMIITDYTMPGMTGCEFLKRLKKSCLFKEIPVVIMSSENVIPRIDTCLEEGAAEFILKPVKISDVKRLKSHIGKGFSNENQRSASAKRKAVSRDFAERPSEIGSGLGVDGVMIVG